MCGIAGHVGPAPLDDARVTETLGRMTHRGPDDQTHRGFTTPDGRHVDLLHARLSIIDLDHRSDQPFALDGAWLAYNGELYNYVEQRKRLEDQGERFATESDTEVLLRALRSGGWDALDGCEGMWAFALYDENSGQLDLVRDRFGEKPLYVLRDGEHLYFGSEVKFIAAMLGPAAGDQPAPPPALPGERLQVAVQDAGDLLRGRRGAGRRHAADRGPGWEHQDQPLLGRVAPAGRGRHDLGGGRGRRARADDPRGGDPTARRRAAGLLHERRRGLHVADLDRQARAGPRRARLHDHELGRALRGGRVSSTSRWPSWACATRRSRWTPPTSCPGCAAWWWPTTPPSTRSPTTCTGC